MLFECWLLLTVRGLDYNFFFIFVFIQLWIQYPKLGPGFVENLGQKIKLVPNRVFLVFHRASFQLLQLQLQLLFIYFIQSNWKLLKWE